MTEARAISAPMARETKSHCGDLGGRVTDRPYAEVVGTLMYLMTCTRLDLAQSVGALSRLCRTLGKSIGRQQSRCYGML
jgi:hypothetical protein